MTVLMRALAVTLVVATAVGESVGWAQSSIAAGETERSVRQARFPGMQPVGSYPIHIIVKNGRTTLLGVVDSAADRQIAEIRAREVTGVFAVDNSLQVAGRSRR